MKYLVGVQYDGGTLQYVPFKDREWFSPFVTRKGADGLHSRIMFVR